MKPQRPARPAADVTRRWQTVPSAAISLHSRAKPGSRSPVSQFNLVITPPRLQQTPSRRDRHCRGRSDLQVYKAIVGALQSADEDTAFGGNGENIASQTVAQARLMGQHRQDKPDGGKRR